MKLTDPMSIKFDQALRQLLKEDADREDRSQSAIVRMIVRRYYQRRLQGNGKASAKEK